MRAAVFVERAFSPPVSSFACALAALYFLSGSGALLQSVLAAASVASVYLGGYLYVRRLRKDENLYSSVPFLPALAVFLPLHRALGLPEAALAGMLAVAGLFLVVFFVRTRWHISAHMMFFVGACSVLSLFDSRMLWLLLLAPLVAWSRLALRRHTYAQIAAGSFAGLAVPHLASQLVAIL